MGGQLIFPHEINMWFVMGSSMDSSHIRMKDFVCEFSSKWKSFPWNTFALFCLTYSCYSGKYVISLKRIYHGLLVAEVLSCMLEFRGFTEAWKFQCFPPPVAPVVAPATRITSAVAPEVLAVQILPWGGVYSNLFVPKLTLLTHLLSFSSFFKFKPPNQFVGIRKVVLHWYV